MSTGRETRLLLVEDDVGIGRLLERGLGAEGYAGLRIYDSKGAPIGLVG